MLAAPPQPTTPHVDLKPAVVVPPFPSAVDTHHPWKIVHINHTTGKVTTESSDAMPAASRFVDGVPVVRVELVSGDHQFCMTEYGPGERFLSTTTGFKGGSSAPTPTPSVPF